MALQLRPEQERRLELIAAHQNRTVDDVAQEALDSYLDHLESLIAAVREGDESGDRNGWIPHEEVFERLNKHLLKSA